MALKRQVDDENTISKGGAVGASKDGIFKVTEGAFHKCHKNKETTYIRLFFFFLLSKRIRSFPFVLHCLCIYRSRVDAQL